MRKDRRRQKPMEKKSGRTKQKLKNLDWNVERTTETDRARDGFHDD